MLRDHTPAMDASFLQVMLDAGMGLTTVLEPTAILAMAGLGFLTGVCSEEGRLLVCSALLVAMFVALALFLKVSNIEFGSQGLLPSQRRWDILVAFSLFSGPGALWALKNFIMPDVAAVHSAIIVLTACVAIFTGTFANRGLYLVVVVVSLVYGFTDLYGFGVRHYLFVSVCLDVVCVVASFATYRKDANSIALLGPMVGFGIGGGAFIFSSPAKCTNHLCVVIATAYVLLLWRRRHRHLPPSLQGCKFVRLEFLRDLCSGPGLGIRRCQDLPPEAFGDPTKAQVLIVVSHRWMNRHTCDVATSEFPQGLRLRTMVQKLDMHFSSLGIGKGRGLGERWRRFCESLISGRDVLVFFDFMSLPQQGIGSDGVVLPRSEEDEALFRQCLPHMGLRRGHRHSRAVHRVGMVLRRAPDCLARLPARQVLIDMRRFPAARETAALLRGR